MCQEREEDIRKERRNKVFYTRRCHSVIRNIPPQHKSEDRMKCKNIEMKKRTASLPHELFCYSEMDFFPISEESCTVFLINISLLKHFFIHRTYIFLSSK